MTKIILKSEQSVTLIGAAPVSRELLDMARSRAPVLVAADGGADQARSLGQTPRLIVGDLDSLVNIENWRDSGIQIIEVAEQDSTDFEKCLQRVTAPVILGCGFLGGRIDHGLAALGTLIGWRQRPVILLGEEDLCLACPDNLDIDLPRGTRVSFFPLAPTTGTLSVGLEWSVEGLTLSPTGRVGTSNRASGGRIRAAFDRPGMILILPVEMLDRVMESLSIPGR